MRKNIVILTALLVLAVCLAWSSSVSADLPSGLIAYWSFDDISGATVPDSSPDAQVSGSGHDGTINGSPGQVASINAAFGTALEFAGIDDWATGDYVLITQDPDLMPTTGMSISAWAELTSDNLFFGAIAENSHDTGGTESGWGMVRDPGYLWYDNSDYSTYMITEDMGGFIGRGESTLPGWHHMVATYDGTEFRVYIDGVEDPDGPIPATGLIDWDPIPTEMTIGFYHDDDEDLSFKGKIDDVAYWNRALSPEEVAQLWNSGAGTPINEYYNYAWNPDPEDGSERVPLDQQFSWQPPLNFTPTKYDVRIGTDPNVSKEIVHESLGQTETTFGPFNDLLNDTQYYVKVTAYEPGTNTPYEGPSWAYRTIPLEPLIDVQPADTVVPVDGTAEFTIEGQNFQNFAWFKTPDDTNATLGNDTPVGGNTQTLTLTNVQFADEGFYYCVVSNAADSVTSETARLWTERLVLHLPMDGNFNDVSLSAITVTPVGSPVIDTGGGISGDALLLNPDDGTEDYLVLDSNDLTFRDTTDFSVSAWVKAPEPKSWAVFITNKNWASGANVGWLMGEPSGGGNFLWNFTGQSGSRADFASDDSRLIADGAWHHVCATMDRDGVAKFYYDGAYIRRWALPSNLAPAVPFDTDITGTGGSVDTGLATLIGCSYDTGDQGLEQNYFWNGSIDEVRIYNYVLDPYAVANLYLPHKPGETICVEDIGPEDVDGNCEINIDDFTMVSLKWLLSNIKP